MWVDLKRTANMKLESGLGGWYPGHLLVICICIWALTRKLFWECSTHRSWYISDSSSPLFYVTLVLPRAISKTLQRGWVKGFVNIFLRVALAVGSVLQLPCCPCRARGTLRNLFTKPFTQPAAPRCTKVQPIVVNRAPLSQRRGKGSLPARHYHYECDLGCESHRSQISLELGRWNVEGLDLR